MTLSARTVRIWAIAIGVMGLLDSLHVLVAAFGTAGRSRATAGWVGFCMAHPAIIALPVLVYAFAWYRFVRRTDRLAWGAAAFGMLWLVVRIWTTAYATGHQDFIQGGATMLGWLLGALWGRALGHAPSRSAEARLEVDRYAATGALALFAATYLCSGTSKLVNSDFQWTGGATIRLMAISHLAVDDTSWLGGAKRWLALDPHVGTALQYLTTMVQIGAFVSLFGRRARALWCSALALLHTGIYVTSGILFFTPLALAAVFAIPWDGRLREKAASAAIPAPPAPAPNPASTPTPAPIPTPASVLIPALPPARPRRVMLATVGGAIALLSLVWLTPLGPALRFQMQPWQLLSMPQAAADDRRAPPAEPPASPAVRAVLGDLPDGKRVGACILRGVTGPGEGRLTLVFDCPGGPATLWVLRRGSSPFLVPSSTARLDVMIQGNGGAGGPTPTEMAELLSAVTAQILATGETGELPAGL